MTQRIEKTMDIIGCGHVGQALGLLWTSHRTFVLQDVLNRTFDSARLAVEFIGTGRAVNAYAELRPADIYLIATPDVDIVECCEHLAQAGLLSSDSIVFHCSGALQASALKPAIECGAAVASIHPIRSFASPEQVAQSFTGTYCGIEGDQRALTVLSAGFAAIGAQLVPINADFKMLYHSAAVFASNYLVTLLDVALQAYQKAGIPRDVALKIIEPLVRKTTDNIFQIGPEEALSGPIARGDLATVVKQYRAVTSWDRRYGGLYKRLGMLTADLAVRRGKSKL